MQSGRETDPLGQAYVLKWKQKSLQCKWWSLNEIVYPYGSDWTIPSDTRSAEECRTQPFAYGPSAHVPSICITLISIISQLNLVTYPSMRSFVASSRTVAAR